MFVYAIQRAIDAAGELLGTVWFPPGQYRCGMLQVRTHVALTGSPRGKELLANFDAEIGKFWLVKPKRISLEALLDDLPGARRQAVAA